jgi:hypothetical protein
VAAEESEEERRERLKLLAKERVSRLVNGEAILPHSAPKYDVAYAKEANLLADRLLDAGLVSLRIGSHTFELEEVDDFRSEGQRTFLIKVDGISLHASVHWVGGFDSARFFFSPSGELERKVRFHSIYGSDAPSESNIYMLLYYALFGARERNWFSDYLTKQRDEILAAEDAAREIEERIRRESERFRDVLLRKYRQLVYVDEYESICTVRVFP